MEPEPADIDRIIQYRDSLFSLACLDFTIYDARGRLLAPANSPDEVIRIFLSSETGEREQAAFIKTATEKAALRKGISIFRGPMNQNHCFIPLQFGDLCIVFVGKAFYVSEEELEELEARGSRYGLSPQDTRSWAKGVVLSELREVIEEHEAVYRLFNLALGDMSERRLNRERYRKARIVVDLLCELDKEVNEYAIHTLLADAVLFLFGGETVSLMIPRLDKYVPVLTKGRLKEKVSSVTLRCHDAVSSAISMHKAVAVTESFELLRSGYPPEVTSLHLFPVGAREEMSGLLAVFNSPFSDDDIESIGRLCDVAALMMKIRRSQEAYAKHMRDITALDLTSAEMAFLKDPDRLCESIVEMSSRLMNTERASLMLPEEEQRELLIKGVKGINKWIARNIRVRIGEGIAGKVYKERKPMIAADMERNLSMHRKPHYRTGSFASIPLKVGDEAIGVLNLADKIDGEVFSEQDMTFLQHFASYASIALKGAQYCRELEEMRTLSITDPLTGLFNRRYFDHRLFEELQRGIRYDSSFSLAIFDIDDFKLFNDTEGHLAGDEVLKALADIARESLRSIDIVARFGGEEFAIIMPQTEKDEAFVVVERARNNIKELMPLTWKQFPRKKITVSTGIAAFPLDGKDARTLIRNADRALYRAKLGGKDRTVVWDSALPAQENAI